MRTSPGIVTIRRRIGAGAAALVLAAAAGACRGSDDASDRAVPPRTTTLPPRTTAAPTTTPPTEPPTTVPAPVEIPPPPPPPPPAPGTSPLADYGEVLGGNPDRPEMALTFDCGSVAGPTPTILEVLRNRGLRVTFFLTGRWMEQNPGLTAEIAAAHELAHHSYSHSDFAEMSDTEILDEMQRTEALFEQLAGRGTKPMWRAPYGSRSEHILQLVAGAGWSTHVVWTVDALDWQQISAEQVHARVLNAAGNGAIALQHCGSPQTAEILDRLITDIQARGLRITTVSDLLR